MIDHLNTLALGILNNAIFHGLMTALQNTFTTMPTKTTKKTSSPARRRKRAKDNLLSAAVNRLRSAVSKYIIPIILGMIVGGFAMHILLTFVRQPQPTLVQQAVQGGTAIPFPSGSPSLMH